jgi:hypothetical protein
LLLDPDGIVEQRSKWGGVVSGAGQAGAGSELDPDRPDLRALVRFAMRGAGQ